MPPLHDYKCKSCGSVVVDSLEHPSNQCCSEPSYEITFQNWKNFNRRRDYCSTNDTHTTDGARRRFCATEDPLVQHELGLLPDHGLRTFSDEQSEYYIGKLMRDGDTPTLRKEILKQRVSNQTSEGITTQEVI
jgi:hypothetical protein